MTRTAERNVKCPNCAHAFTVEVPMSNTTAAPDTDFRPNSLGGDIIDLLIHTCSHCGFTGDETEFSGKVAPEVSALIAQRLTPLVRDERARPWRRYEYAAWIAQWRGKSERNIAAYYLRASWCCRLSWDIPRDDTRQDGTEEYYRRKAVEHFERALDTGSVHVEEIDVITYLVGELHRRVGEFDEAGRWFRRAVELADGQWVANIARKQAALAEQAGATPGDVRGDAHGD